MSDSEPENLDIDFEGILNISLKKKLGRAHYKHWYVVLAGSTLHLYKTQQTEQPQHSVSLKGSVLTELKQPEFAFSLACADAELSVACVGADEKKAWLQHINTNAVKIPSSPPVRRARALKRRDSLGSRGMKKLVSKGSTSHAGKALLRKYATEEAMELLQALKAVVKFGIGKEKAKAFENNVIKVGVKAYMLLDKGTLTSADFEAIDAPMRQCFSAIDRLFLLEKDARSRKQLRAQLEAALAAEANENDQSVDSRRAKEEEALGVIAASCAELRAGLTKIMEPHLTLKNLNRIAEAFAVFNQDFLRAVFQQAAMEDNLETLNSAMLSYTSIL